MTYSGQFTHISSHLSAVGGAQNRERSLVKDQRSTTALHNQLSNTVYHVPSVMLLGLWRWQNRLSWKLVIALPVVSAAPQFINFSDWLKCKFSVGSVPSKEADSQVSVNADLLSAVCLAVE